MKQAIVVFVIAIVVGAGVNSLVASYPTYKVKEGVLSVQQVDKTSGMNVEESIIPEMSYVDGYRKFSFMTRVGNNKRDSQTDFPVNAGVQE